MRQQTPKAFRSRRPLAALAAARTVGLDESQGEAVRTALSRRLTVIWGPPGTGKTKTLQGFLHGLVREANDHGGGARILVTGPTYKAVGEVAARSGLAVSALHFYEAKGLIASVRSGGNQRRYPRSVLRRVAVIKIAQRMGLPLATIADALQALPEGRTPTVADWRRLSAAWREELDQRIATLTRLRDQLDGCIGCGCLSLKTCALSNPDDEVAERGPGAVFLEPTRRR